MPATILDGKALAKQIQAETKESVSKFVSQQQVTPTLAAVLVGDDPASQVYVRNKDCLLYTSPSPRDQRGSRMPSSA